MTANSKSMILLAATLVVGFALGLFSDATLRGGRRGQIDRLRRPPGFVEHMESVIQPHSDAQRDSIKPALDRVAQFNQQLFKDADVRMRAGLDSMQATLAPILDAQQRDRLAAEVNRGPKFGRGRGGRGGGVGAAAVDSAAVAG
ncbi:MAG: hypothetical protein ABI442_17200 [Gemmatimonadaceae bacterium]